MLFLLLIYLNERNYRIVVGDENTVHAVISLSVGQGRVALHIGENVVDLAFFLQSSVIVEGVVDKRGAVFYSRIGKYLDLGSGRSGVEVTRNYEITTRFGDLLHYLSGSEQTRRSALVIEMGVVEIEGLGRSALFEHGNGCYTRAGGLIHTVS